MINQRDWEAKSEIQPNNKDPARTGACNGETRAAKGADREIVTK